MAQHIIEGAGNPTTIPTDLGQHYVDTVGGNHWISVGTSASSDWKQSNGTGGGVGASSFLDLDDSPVNYVGSAGLLVAVNAGATGVEFVAGGAAGPQGDQGIQGIQGIQGDTGSDGSTGTQGLQGIQGDAGTAGSTGAQGIQGIQGVTGDDGAAGGQGIQGDQGDTGSDGAAGTQGIQGIQGDAGADGATGTQGIQGIQGDEGAAGGQGIQGIQGTIGLTGSDGDDGQGVIAGGTVGQVLKKQSSTDFDTIWQDESGGGVGGNVVSVFGRIGSIVGESGDYSKSDVGLGNVDNTTDALKVVSGPAQTALDLKLDATLKGANSGLAELDISGKVPTAQLPAFVDEVEESANLGAFPGTGDSGKIYVAIDTGLIYRWGGSAYVVISSTIALGETSATAYRGDRGKTAFDHTSLTANPHAVTKSQIGLGNADDTSDADKPVSTAGQTALDLKEDDLLNPGTTGFVLSSTTGGARSWIAPDTGPQGVQGIQGDTGSQGIQGDTGADGSTGSQGLQGIQGDAGTAGSTGTQGIQGIQGDAGSDGATGGQGIQGLQGLQGDEGAAGGQGVQGIQGEAGVDGTNGLQGIQGIQGDEGSTGGQGVQGTAGSDGTDGASILSGIIDPTGGQGADGDSFLNTVSGETFLKSSGSWALDGGDLTGPTGTTGTTGTTGSDGDDGASFLSGVIVPTGGIGIDGDSYANTITGVTYLKSGGSWFIQGDLKGPQGDAGTDVSPDFDITTGVDVKATTQVYSELTALSDIASIATDCTDGNVFAVTLGGNRTLANPSDLRPGATYLWIITQDGTGSRTLAYGSAFKFPGGNAPTLSTGAAAVDLISGVSDGSDIYCSLVGDFA